MYNGTVQTMNHDFLSFYFEKLQNYTAEFTEERYMKAGSIH